MSFLKKIFTASPASLQGIFLRMYELYFIWKWKSFIPYFDYVPKHIMARKPRILFYHLSGLSFAGTEKFLQILAKYIDKGKYDVFFMYSPKPRPLLFGKATLDGRRYYLNNQGITLIPFEYDSLDSGYPYVVSSMVPNIFDVIRQNEIDLVVSAGSGYSEFPFLFIKDLPIILVNIFGSPNAQKNIANNICISYEVAKKISGTVPKEKINVMYIQSEGPAPDSIRRGLDLRRELRIPDNSIVFGRIGRANDGIFDPIGLTAFARVVAQNPDIHYIIMSPPPVARRFVDEHNISNVHFIEPTANEDEVWAFHNAIDVMAHFRADGESFGLNIAEAMLCGKPIITHRSRIWNAHLEYLRPEFSFVADVDDVDSYADAITFFAKDDTKSMIRSMGGKARMQAEALFLMKNNIHIFERWINDALVDKHH